MTNALGKSWPWFGRRSEQAEEAETTPGGQESTPWVVVATVGPGEAMIIKGRLESENIPALVQQEAMGSVLGLTVGPLGSAKVLVPEPLAEQALDILADTFEPDNEDHPDEDDEPETETDPPPAS